MLSASIAKNMTCSICLTRKNKIIKFKDHSFNEMCRCMAWLQTAYLTEHQQTRELDDK